MFWILNIIAAFVLSHAFTAFVTWNILSLSYHKQLFDVPDDRKIHEGLVPRLGGVAFNPVVFFTLALMLAVNAYLGNSELQDAVGLEVQQVACTYCAMTLAYLTGIIDDLMGVRYVSKFIIQFVIGLLLIGGGVMITDFHGLLGIGVLPLWASVPLSIFATIFIINAINLIDGIDGLALGLCIGTFAVYGAVFYLAGMMLHALLAAASLGSLVSLFLYNVFGNVKRKRKIFMGDTGCMVISVMICYLSCKVANIEDLRGNDPNLFVLSFSPLLVPCLDVVRVFLYRVRHGKNPFLPDRHHIHHKLLDLGMKPWQAMVALILSTGALTAINVELSRSIDVTLLLALDIALWTAINLVLRKRIEHLKNNAHTSI